MRDFNEVMCESKTDGQPASAPARPEGKSSPPKQRRMTGTGGRANFPASTAPLETDEGRAAVRTALSEVLVSYKQPRVTSDEEMLDRIAAYFSACVERGSHPVIEELCLYLGYTYHGIYDIETGKRKGFSANTAKIIKKAKFVVQTLDAKLATSGHLNFLAYCFRAKNYYGMADKVEHVITPGTEREEYDAKSIAERYLLEDKAGTSTYEATGEPAGGEE